MTDDDEFFSAEAEDAILAPTSEDERTLVEQNNPSGTTESSESSEKPKISSIDLSDGYKTRAKPQKSKSPFKSSLHSRDTRDNTSFKTHKKTDQRRKKKEDSKTDETPMVIDDETNMDEDSILLSTPSKKSKSGYYNPLLYYIMHNVLHNVVIHNNSDIIYIIDFQTLFTSLISKKDFLPVNLLPKRKSTTSTKI